MEYPEEKTYQQFKRYCKTLQLRNDPELIENYIRVHREVWPEINQGMREIGILDMEIFIQGTHLFMIMDTLPEFDHERDMDRLSRMPRQKEWEAYVSHFQDASADATADEKWRLMERIFNLK